MKIFLLTVGTRGDVQPFVALGMGLRQAGHDVTLCTTAGFAPFVEAHGLRCAPLNNELVELAASDAGRRAVDNFGGGPLAGVRWIAEAARRFPPIFRRLLAEQWEAARGAELVVYHPNAVGGVHLAEALGVPGVMADMVPTWVPTGAFPSFLFPDPGLGRRYNRLTYRLLPALARGTLGGVVARWRGETLRLPPRPRFAADYVRSDGGRVPVLYGFSRRVLPPPDDWPAHVSVTGYWFLDESAGWEPPEALLDFLDRGPPPVFVGFGSMAGRDPSGLARTMLAALRRAGRRGILATGWGGLEVADAPADVYVTRSVPYDWLLPRVAAVVNHGGAGTTAAALRAGKPSVVCPFVADQPFWGARLAALGVAPAPIPQRRLTPDALAAAIRTAVGDAQMQERAAHLGAQIRAEQGVQHAVARIEAAVP